MENTASQPMEHDGQDIKSYGARCPELEKVQKIMDLYIDGVRHGKVALLQEAFHPQSSMFGWKGNDLFVTPIQGPFYYIGSTPIPSKTGEPTTLLRQFR